MLSLIILHLLNARTQPTKIEMKDCLQFHQFLISLIVLMSMIYNVKAFD